MLSCRTKISSNIFYLFCLNIEVLYIYIDDCMRKCIWTHRLLGVCCKQFLFENKLFHFAKYKFQIAIDDSLINLKTFGLIQQIQCQGCNNKLEVEVKLYMTGLRVNITITSSIQLYSC